MDSIDGGIPCSSSSNDYYDSSLTRSIEKTKLDFLYSVFKEHASKYDIKTSSKEFADRSIAIQEKISTRCKKLDGSSYSKDKIITALLTFIRKNIDDMGDEYTRQPLGKITMVNLVSKTIEIKALMKELIAITDERNPFAYSDNWAFALIEIKIRRAIRAKHTEKEFSAAAAIDKTAANFYNELAKPIPIAHSIAVQRIYERRMELGSYA